MALSVLGYPSLTAAVLAMYEEGMKPGQIAKRLDRQSSQVSSLISNARGRPRMNFRPDRDMINIPLSGSERLRPYADAREVSISRLAAQVLDVVLRDELVDAILDDGLAASQEETDHG